MDAQEELAFLRSVAASQLQTIKALTLGCEKYGLTETTPVVRHLAAQDDEIERLRAELAKADGQINRCVDQNKYLESTISRLREYAKHKRECWSFVRGGHDCDCGYAALLADLGEGK